MNIKMLQWNIRYIRSNRPQLEHLLRQYDIDFAIIAELWLEPDTHFSASGYLLTYCLRRDSYGGCGKFVINNILHDRLPFIMNHPQEGTQICGEKYIKDPSGKMYCPYIASQAISCLCQTDTPNHHTTQERDDQHDHIIHFILTSNIVI